MQKKYQHEFLPCILLYVSYFETMVKGKYLLDYILWWHKYFFPIYYYVSLWFVKRKKQICKGHKRKFLTSSTKSASDFSFLSSSLHLEKKERNKIL